ncbi:MAG: hypothetical protein U5R31_12270 [Acidimicrobiia bacterium]|nr:hypothetical protein [Acidimicrobiia bacterium]
MAYEPARTESDCTHTYQRSSRHEPDGTYAAEATVTYEITWSATTGEGGDLGTLARSTTIPVTVQEAQALVD